ncbi:signal peptidase I [Moorena bouillonii]|uniref:Signal peptidase I n=1 Tax=Moorena bouillonii PNG TaxID=568701 RepID=A0A1U7N6R3_9CYAN|nr:signal peptidase I [Moorena bouillonii]OLT61632.1 signal peptidase I [Moorena bouillonii PNG]
MTEERKRPERQIKTGRNYRETDFGDHGSYSETNYYYNSEQPRHLPAPLWKELQRKLIGWLDRDQYAASRIRKKLLEAVKREVTTRLQDSLHQDQLEMNLYLELPMEESKGAVERAERQKVIPLPPQTSAMEVFERPDVKGRLLILGEPGSGKTTTLLRLAEALVRQAEQNHVAPIPIIFELSAWKNDQQPLDQWLVAQLKDKYSIDEKISQQWFKNHQLLPLLDGLDELGIPRQRLCVTKINQFFKQNIERRGVVCCRLEEYQQGRVKLRKLNGAYCLQSPNKVQIQDYLQRLGKPEFWQVLSSDTQMRELADKPLFLNVMVTAYQRQPITNKAQLWSAYVEQRLKLPLDEQKYPKGVPYGDEETRHWLTYLARQLVADSTTEFLIENMQSYWLKKGFQRSLFRLISGLIIGLLYGLIFGLLSDLIFGLLYGLIFGLILGLNFTDFKDYERQAKAFSVSWYGLTSCLIFGLTSCLIFGLTSCLIFGLNFLLIFGLNFLLILFLGWIIFGRFFCLKTELAKENPNQSIKESFKKTFIIPLFAFPAGALIFPFVSIFTPTNFDLTSSLRMGLLVGLVSAIASGGQDWIPHLTLRLILWQRGAIPWNYARFLSYAAERRLIQQVGGRYRFIHDSLRQYFVGNEPVPAPLIEGYKNPGLGYILLGFSLFVFLILSSSIYRVDSGLESTVVPVVQSGDVVLRDIVTRHWRKFHHGDVIDFWVKKNLAQQGFNGKKYIMRIVALPGETFAIKQGEVYINGQRLQTDYIQAILIQDDDEVDREIPSCCYLVLGKNPDDQDKLLMRLVHRKQIYGKVLFRLFPFGRFGRVD